MKIQILADNILDLCIVDHGIIRYTPILLNSALQKEFSTMQDLAKE